MEGNIAWIILAMTAATYPVRLVPMLLFNNSRISEAVELCIQIMPLCIMVSMIVIDLATDAEIAVQKLLALALVLWISCSSKNVGLGVLTGVLIYSLIAS